MLSFGHGLPYFSAWSGVLLEVVWFLVCGWSGLLSEVICFSFGRSLFYFWAWMLDVVMLMVHKETLGKVAKSQNLTYSIWRKKIL